MKSFILFFVTVATLQIMVPTALASSDCRQEVKQGLLIGQNESCQIEDLEFAEPGSTAGVANLDCQEGKITIRFSVSPAPFCGVAIGSYEALPNSNGTQHHRSITNSAAVNQDDISPVEGEANFPFEVRRSDCDAERICGKAVCHCL